MTVPARGNEDLRAIPDPEQLCKVGTGDTVQTKRAGIRRAFLGSSCKLMDEELRFTLEEVSMDTKEGIFHLLAYGGQNGQDTQREWRTRKVMLPSLR
jgi:hypothetical protein